MTPEQFQAKHGAKGRAVVNDLLTHLGDQHPGQHVHNPIELREIGSQLASISTGYSQCISALKKLLKAPDNNKPLESEYRKR